MTTFTNGDFLLILIAVFAFAFWAGCLFTEWRSLKETARCIDQFHQRAARPNTRKGA